MFTDKNLHRERNPKNHCGQWERLQQQMETILSVYYLCIFQCQNQFWIYSLDVVINGVYLIHKNKFHTVIYIQICTGKQKLVCKITPPPIKKTFWVTWSSFKIIQLVTGGSIRWCPQWLHFLCEAISPCVELV